MRELREGIDDTGVRAGFLKCAVESHGIIGDIPRILAAIAAAAVETGAPVMVHTNAAAKTGLLALEALTKAGVEASPQALPRLLHSLPHALSYPVAIDRSGTVADGYRVQDSPWLELVSSKGRFLFYEDLAVKGWPTLKQLLTRVRVAQTK